MIKVRATQIGFYNNATYNPGDVFNIPDEKLFSDKWMEKVNDKPAPVVPPSTATIPVVLTGKEPIKEPRRDLPPIEPVKPHVEPKI